MSMATTEATSPEKVLKSAEPLSRESLADCEIVTALWSLAPWTNAFGIQNVVQDHETEGNIFLLEIMTALQYHEIRDSKKRYSLGFEHILNRCGD